MCVCVCVCVYVCVTHVELADTLDVGSVLAAGSSEATRPGVTHPQVALLL